jgi:hypothetical protein
MELNATVILVRSRSDDYSRVTVRDDNGAHHSLIVSDPWRLHKGDAVLIEVDEDGYAHLVGVPRA